MSNITPEQTLDRLRVLEGMLAKFIDANGSQAYGVIHIPTVPYREVANTVAICFATDNRSFSYGCGEKIIGFPYSWIMRISLNHCDMSGTPSGMVFPWHVIVGGKEISYLVSEAINECGLTLYDLI